MSGHLSTGGRPINPDTDRPMPSPSAAQEQLADALLARLVDNGVGAGLIAATRDRIRDALVEVAVRQHGRTLRACLVELIEQAQLRDDNARYALGSIPDAPAPVDGDALARAYRSGIEAAALRAVRLRGDRA